MWLDNVYIMSKNIVIPENDIFLEDPCLFVICNP